MDDKELKRENKRIALISDYKRTFETDHGQKVLKDMMKRFGMLRTSAAAEDPYLTYFNEGQRQVVVWLLERLKINVHDLHNMINKMGEENE